MASRPQQPATRSAKPYGVRLPEVALPEIDFDLIVRAIQLADTDDSALRIISATPILIDNRARDHDDHPTTISRATFVLRSAALDSLLLDEFTMEVTLRVRDRLAGMQYGTLIEAHATVMRSDLSWHSKTRMLLIAHTARSVMREFIDRVAEELARDATRPEAAKRKVPNFGMLFAYQEDPRGRNETANPAWQKAHIPRPYPSAAANPAVGTPAVA